MYVTARTDKVFRLYLGIIGSPLFDSNSKDANAIPKMFKLHCVKRACLLLKPLQINGHL